MPRAKANKTYRNFVKGLITEAGPLNFPENSTKDEDNCELYIKGNRKRRLGFNPENNFSLSSQTVSTSNWTDYAINTTTWNTVGGDGNTNFLVVQIGPTLYFYNQASTPLSDGQKSFTVNLIDFSAPGATNIGNYVVQTASGKGFLFVVGSHIESFYISYDADADTISTTQIDIEVRDFAGLDDGLDPDEEPSTLSKEHSYNLKNQGWLPPANGITDPTTTYQTAAGRYPANSQQWWQAKDVSDDFSAALMRKFGGGNTLAPRGHYILEAFYKDRSTVSGVANIAVESVSSRPSAVGFFSGRVFYAGVSGGTINGHVFFSQVVEDESKIGRCYQVNDPTSEDLNSLLDTDGGVIVIPEAGSVLALFPMKNSLLVFADNGIWSISGTDGGFKATDFKVNKVSSIGITGASSIVDAEGVPVWWGVTGIHTVSVDEVSQEFGVSNISRQTIQTFYNEIPALSKVDAKGVYDKGNKKVRWLYRSTAPSGGSNRFRFDSILTLDTVLGAFYPWTISALASTPYYVGSAFASPTVSTLLDDEAVEDGSDAVLDGVDAVVAGVAVSVGDDTFVKYFCFREGASSIQWTFGNFTSTEFKDWFTVDNTGVDYTSFFETGDEILEDVMRLKQAKYLHVFFNRTETAYTDGTFTAWENPSGCYVQSRWEWSDHINSHKWSPLYQVYRFRREYTPSSGTDYNSGFPVIITKNKLRGIGRALRLRFSSESGKDFDILGWALSFTGNTED